jgi:hypothetical protein
MNKLFYDVGAIAEEYNGRNQRRTENTMVDKILHRKLNIGQHAKKRCKVNSPHSHILEELVILRK